MLLRRADPHPRIDYYVRHGLVERAPTDAQLARADAQNQTRAGTLQRIGYYARHPLDLLPTAAKRRQIRRSVQDVSVYGNEAEALPDEKTRLASRPEGLDWLDRSLRGLALFSPFRFAAQCVYNPFYPLPSSGLDVPTRYLIEHVLHSPHPTALWDLQILAADPGGLDALERDLAIARDSRRFKGRLYRALAQRDGYYEYLAELLPRVRRFDYPPTPPGFVRNFENLVAYLNFAATLEA